MVVLEEEVTESLPSRERGLKQQGGKMICPICEVAPFAGAWIETDKGGGGLSQVIRSLPSRERGLKLQIAAALLGPDRSLPSRERGLKPRWPCLCPSRPGRSLRGSVD